MTDPEPALEVVAVSKHYGNTPALRRVSLRAAPGAIVGLLGPSGCGKTTLLRVVAGLEHADSGVVRFAGRSLDGVPVHRRGFGLMFQEYALFPHRSVAENVAFGLRMRGDRPALVAARVAEMLELVGLAGYGRRWVHELSGGERQRVALARSLAPSPRLLMLDEPLGALDRALRERLLDELRAILKRVGVTSLYVTHDQSEAFALADWLVLLQAGQVVQQGPPQALYRHPASLFTARFLGMGNLLAGHVRARAGALLLVECALGLLHVAAPAGAAQPGERVTLVIRPEAAVLDAGAPNQIHAVVAERSFRGGWTRLTLRHATGVTLALTLDAAELPAAGDPLTLGLRPSAISLIAEGLAPMPP